MVLYQSLVMRMMVRGWEKVSEGGVCVDGFCG